VSVAAFSGTANALRSPLAALASRQLVRRLVAVCRPVKFSAIELSDPMLEIDDGRPKLADGDL
jgi:hypothetical protein